MEDEITKMTEFAMQARKQAYAPYSGFCVGACLQAETGEYYTGCNIENASYSATNCAERTAFFKAVSKGKRKFQKIVIVGGKKNEKCEVCPPCGVCLQVMAEFCDPNTFQIILPDGDGGAERYLLKNLLPKGFQPSVLA